jgi:hypothetical protein
MVQGRVAILKVHARDKKVSKRVDYTRVARASAGFTGAQLMNLMNVAAIVTVRRGGAEILETDIFQVWFLSLSFFVGFLWFLVVLVGFLLFFCFLCLRVWFFFSQAVFPGMWVFFPSGYVFFPGSGLIDIISNSIWAWARIQTADGGHEWCGHSP